MNNEQLNKVVTIKMRSGISFQGVLVGIGSKWALLKYIPVDYVIDGYILISRNYIFTVDITEDDSFTEAVLKLKNVHSKSIDNFDLDNTEQLILDLKSQFQLIGIKLKKNQSQYVGSIQVIREKSMRVHLINKRCKWLEVETFLYNELRAIYFENDYLESLQLYNAHIQQKDNQDDYLLRGRG